MTRRLTLRSEVSTSKEERTLTIAVIGESGVGKSTIVSRLLKHWHALANHVQKKKKNGVDDFGIRGRDLTVEIISTSSQKWFPLITALKSYDVFVLAYSLVNDKSFDTVCAVREEILQKHGPDVPIVFVANKTDIADFVDKTERAYRDLNISCEWEHAHEEISAEKDENVDQVLEQIMKRFNKKSSPRQLESPFFRRMNKIKDFFSGKKAS